MDISRIKELADEKGITLSFIIGKLGLTSRTYFIDIERYNRTISDERLKIIADILDTTPEYITFKTDKKEKPAAISDELMKKIEDNPNAVKLLDMLLQMSPEQLEKMTDFVSALKDSK